MATTSPRERLIAVIGDLEQIIATLDAATAPGAAAPRMAVIVGHSAASPGASAPALGVNEYTWNVDLARRMAAHARRLGQRLEVITRDNGGAPEAYRRASAAGARAILELHFNAAANAAASGTETIWDAPHDKPLALAVQAAMAGVLGLPDRGVRPPWRGRGAANDDAAQFIPSVIVEPFFGSNKNDCRRANARKQQLAEALVGALASYVAPASDRNAARA